MRIIFSVALPHLSPHLSSYPSPYLSHNSLFYFSPPPPFPPRPTFQFSRPRFSFRTVSSLLPRLVSFYPLVAKKFIDFSCGLAVGLQSLRSRKAKPYGYKLTVSCKELAR